MTPTTEPSYPPPHQSELVLSTVEQDDIDDFQNAVSLGFHAEFHADDWEPEKQAFETGRWFGFRAGDRWVASALSMGRRMAVPGGAVDIAAVTAVTVAPSFRRRRLLTRMMQHQLTTISEPVALLWSSESLIYGRFGYGGVTRQLRLSGPTRELAFLPEVDLGPGSVDEVTRDRFLAAAGPLRESTFSQRPGYLERTDHWWRAVLSDPERHRDGAGPRRYALHFGQDGTPDGFASFRIKRDSSIMDFGREVSVIEIDAITPQAYASLWRFLLDLDLVRSFTRHNAPTDEPLHQLVANPRMIKTELTDGAYARIVDVPAALGARTYNADLDVVIDVVDAFLPESGGRFRLVGGGTGAEVTRTDNAPDLTLTARQLGAIYLGGTSPRDLARAGLVTEHTAGTVARLTTGFAADRAPYCTDFF